MDLQIKGKNCKVPEAFRDYVEKKMEKLSRYFQPLINAEVEIQQTAKKSAGPFKAEVTLHAPGAIFRSEVKAQDPRAAFDLAYQRVKQRLTKFKEKIRRRPERRRTSRAQIMRELIPVSPLPKVERVKRVSLEPMTTEEAIWQMQQLGHNFFLFYDRREKSPVLVYQREDESVGVMIPEVPPAG